MRAVLFVLTFKLVFTAISSSCVESYALICETISDVVKNGQKQWTSLIVGAGSCEAAATTQKEYLDEHDLDKCSNIEELYIINRLQNIHSNAFHVLESLHHLNLYKNDFRVVPEKMFSEMFNLYKVDLQYNNIQIITQGAFFKTPYLKIIDFSNNKLNHVGNNIYNINSVKTVRLANNNISIIEPEAFSNYLETLDLSGNSFTRLRENIFFNLINLKDLNLSRNKMKKLEKNVFNGLDNLFKLDVSHNNIDTIEVKALDNLKNMKILQLAHNDLKIIKPDVFPKNNPLSLQSLRLDHNKLSFLSLQVLQRLSTLRRISVGGNPWQCVCLENLQLEMNNLSINLTPCDVRHYFSGKNPTCMQFKADECVENAEAVGNNFPTLYFTALQNFSYDCP